MSALKKSNLLKCLQTVFLKKGTWGKESKEKNWENGKKKFKKVGIWEKMAVV